MVGHDYSFSPHLHLRIKMMMSRENPSLPFFLDILSTTRPDQIKKRNLPFSAFLRFLLLQILTAQTERTMQATKNSIPPTIPAATAFFSSWPLDPTGPEKNERLQTQ